MADIQWRQPAFNPVRFNPNAGLAVASRSFQGISDAVRERQAAESLAKTRADTLALNTRKQDYTEGATQRAIDLEERALAKSVEQGKLLSGIVDDPSMSRRDTIFGDTGRLAESPEFRELSGLQVGGVGPMQPGKAEATYAAQDVWAERNKAALQLPPAEMEKKIFTDLINSGKVSREDARLLAKEETAIAHPRLSEDMAKTTLQALKPVGKGNTVNIGAGGKILPGSSSGSYKLYQSQLDSKGESEFHKDFMERNPDISKGQDASLLGVEMDWKGWFGKEDITSPDIRKVVAQMKQRGIDAPSSYGVIEKYIESGNNFPYDLKNMSDAQKTAFETEAKDIMSFGRETYNTKTGTPGGAAGALYAELAAQNNWKNTVSDVLGRVTPTNISNEKLTTAFLGSIQTPKQPTIAPETTRNPASGAQTKGGTDDNTQSSSGILPAPAVGGETLPPPGEQVGLPADVKDIQQAPVAGPNDLGISLADLPQTEGQNLLDTIKGTASEVPGVIGSALSKAQAFKDKSYGKQTNRVIDQIKNTGNLDGVSGSDVKTALASKNVSPEEKAVIRQLFALRKRR